jgi:Spy/CpxP family protein refolding chaperone
MPRLLFIALLTLLAVASTACDGKDCTDRPTAEEGEERFVDRVEDYLDDADATDDQEERILALAKALTPVREVMRERFEPHRNAILEQMLADTPDLAVIDREVQGAADAMLDYSDDVVDQALKAHQALKPEQRASLADELAEPPEPFELDWKARAAIDLFLVDIGATSAQKAMVRDEMVSVEKGVRDVQTKQHAIRKAILPHIRSNAPDADAIKALVHKGGTYSVDMIQSLARTYVRMMKNLEPKQRAKAKKRLGALKRCPAT